MSKVNISLLKLSVTVSAFKPTSSSGGSLRQKYANLQVFIQLENFISNYHASSRKRATEEFFI